MNMFSGLKSLRLSRVNKAVSPSRPLSVLSSRRLTELESWTHDVQQHTSGFYFVDDLSFSRLASLFCTLPTREVDAYDFRKTFNMNKNEFGEFELPPLHTLAFFYPRLPESRLAINQTEKVFCPPEPFTVCSFLA